MEAKVYVHYFKDNETNIEYRWRTLLKIGNSWKICGTIFMKNPGSSHLSDTNHSPITNKEILDKLKRFDYAYVTSPHEWYEFSVDNTMTYVIKLFESYYSAHQETLEGVIQIFNLFNIRDADLNNANNKSNGKIIKGLTYTIDDDIKNIVYPVYIGWGELWRNPTHRDNAKKIFSEVKQKTSYLRDGIQNNKYYHPQYLMNYGKNKYECILALARFKEIGFDLQNCEMNPLICLMKEINPSGYNRKFVNGTLSYEYFCNGVDGYKRHNGTITIGLCCNERSCYLLSIITKGNHPDKLVALVCDFCKLKRIFIKDNSNDASFIAEARTEKGIIVEFMNGLLAKIKAYRETDYPE